MATGSSADRQVRVWNTESGREVLSLAVGPSPRASFSPDGQWLATFGETFSLHRVGTWTVAPRLPLREDRAVLGAAAFSRSGRMLALVCDLYAVQLIDLANFRPLGLLQTPGLVALQGIRFSRDDYQLAAVGAVGRLQIWDLAGIRRQLGDFGVDWDGDASPAEVKPGL
jgi:WD40 repeat protein